MMTDEARITLSLSYAEAAAVLEALRIGVREALQSAEWMHLVLGARARLSDALALEKAPGPEPIAGDWF